jgi:hypothetical protein
MTVAKSFMVQVPDRQVVAGPLDFLQLLTVAFKTFFSKFQNDFMISSVFHLKICLWIFCKFEKNFAIAKLNKCIHIIAYTQKEQTCTS